MHPLYLAPCSCWPFSLQKVSVLFVLYLNFVSRGDKISHVVSTGLGHSVMREILLRSLVLGCLWPTGKDVGKRTARHANAL